MKRIQIDSEEQLKEVAEALLESLDGRTVVALRGEMGAGKTTLIRSVAEALGAEDQVTSPTFALVNQYEGANGERISPDMVESQLNLGVGCCVFGMEDGELALVVALPPDTVNRSTEKQVVSSGPMRFSSRVFSVCASSLGSFLP